MITVADEAVANRMRRLREHGMDVSAIDRHRSDQPVIERYTEVGFNVRMTDIQAAIGLVQMGKLPEMVARRREPQRAGIIGYSPGIPGLTMIDAPAIWRHLTFSLSGFLLAEDSPVSPRRAAMRELARAGISARRGIMAAHLEPAYESYEHTPLPISERLTMDALILPLFHEMTYAEQDFVADTVMQELVDSKTKQTADEGAMTAPGWRRSDPGW